MVALLALLSLPAAAGDLVADWTGPLRYHAEALVQTPNGHRYYGQRNIEATATTHEIAIDLTCVGQRGSRDWAVECTLDQVALGGRAFSDDIEDLAAIHREYEGLLLGQTIQLDVSFDGRIGTLDLEGVSKRDDRMAGIHEDLRQLLRRAAAPLDLGLPKGGVAKAGTWRQKGTALLFQLFTSYGTAGGSVMRHTIEGQDGAVVRFSSEGRGNMATGLDFEVGAGQIVNMLGFGQGRFDTDRGLILARSVTTSGELTAGSVHLGDPMVYALDAWVGLIEADGTVNRVE